MSYEKVNTCDLKYNLLVQFMQKYKLTYITCAFRAQASLNICKNICIIQISL